MSSQEFLLTAACCRWPPSDGRAAAVRAAAKAVSDWDGLLRVVTRHRVAVLVLEALRAPAIEVPADVLDELERLVRHHVHRGLRLAAETARLQNLLSAAGIPNLVLKGATLEQLAYGSIASKQTRDIDLLVRPEAAEAALQLIERDGYALSLPAKKLNRAQRYAIVRFGREAELVQPRTNVHLELQWRTADNPLLLNGVDAHAAAQDVSLAGGRTVRTLAPNDLFAYLCAHGARHSWSRLKWLADLNALLVSSNADIAHLYRHARRIGAGLCAAQALLLCERLLGLGLPAALAQELATDKRHSKLVAVAMAAMRAPNIAVDVGIGGVIRDVRNQFLLGRGWRFYVMQCRLALVGSADIVRLPLPGPLYFIYPLVRLPLWLWRRLNFGLLAAAPTGIK